MVAYGETLVLRVALPSSRMSDPPLEFTGAKP